MSTIETTRPAPSSAVATYHFMQFVSTGLGRVKGWSDARATRKALSALSDRELDDIGLCRGDIDHIG
ncbi:MAG: DUF1127 domain-containing protein [Rhodobacter sp.]